MGTKKVGHENFPVTHFFILNYKVIIIVYVVPLLAVNVIGAFPTNCAKVVLSQVFTVPARAAIAFWMAAVSAMGIDMTVVGI